MVRVCGESVWWMCVERVSFVMIVCLVRVCVVRVCVVRVCVVRVCVVSVFREGKGVGAGSGRGNMTGHSTPLPSLPVKR